MAKKNYVYKIEILNMVSGVVKGVQEYESKEPLKVGHIYFHLPGLPVGGYRVIKGIRT